MSDKELLEEALTGIRGDDQKLIAEEVMRFGALLIRKNTDYGSSVWQEPILAPGCDPGAAIRVRMSDKVSRLRQLLSKPALVENESIDDTLRDLGAYCLLELARPNRKKLNSMGVALTKAVTAERIEVGDVVYAEPERRPIVVAGPYKKEA